MAAESRIITRAGYTLAAVSLCSLIVSPVGQAFAVDASSSSASAVAQESTQDVAVVATSKSETVNVSTRADGTVKSVEVSTTLEANGNRVVIDASNLSDLKPDSDDVYYTNEGELIWHSPKGEAITYTGATTAQLPIELRVSYRLDGAAIAPSELAGKSGHVVIRYDYINSSWRNGGGFAVYTPFVAITGMLLDSDVFSNVKITNGKLVEDSDRTIAIGYAMPGLAKSLDLGSDVDIPDYFEVEADVVDFELKSTLTMVSSDMFEDIDTSDLNTSEYSDASKDLTSAMSQLIDGSGSLTEGLDELSKGIKELSDGAAELDGGMSATTMELPALEQGVAQLHSGSSQLVMLANGLLQGLATVKTNVALSQQGAAQLAAGLQNDNVKALAAVLGAAAQELAADVAKVEAINAQADAVIADAAAASGAVAAYDSSIDSIEGLTDEQKAALRVSLASVESSVAQVNADAQALKDADKQLSDQAVQQAAGALQMADFSQLSEAATRLADGLQAILDQGFGTEQQQRSLFGVATMMRNGVSSLDEGLAVLETQSGQLVEGISKIASGVSQLAIGAKQLSEGSTSAADGSNELTDGLKTFNDEGISKIVDAIDNKLVKIGTRFKEVVKASGSYKNFAGITDGTTGSVMFVFETDAIETS